MTAPAACIFGCESLRLTPSEKQFFKANRPWGFILFGRNIKDAAQIRALTAELRDTVGADAPILIDQEGGRVQRLRGPDWAEWLPPLTHVARNPDAELIKLRYRIIAAELYALGIDVNCAPMLDIAHPGSHEIIKNRCFGHDAETVATMGRAAANGLLAGGVLPILKHIPGHGRATMDSHFELPHLNTPLATLQNSDFLPFKQLADMPMAMTAHIVYQDIDPDHCATQSRKVIDTIRRDIGFGGLIMSDDLSMKALKGRFADRCQASVDAGCDVLLHCNGMMAEMVEVAGATPALSGKALARATAALKMRKTPDGFDLDAAKIKMQPLLAEAA